VFFFSVKFFRNPRLIDSGLRLLSDCPLPYPLPPEGLPYWSSGGDAEAIAARTSLNAPGLGMPPSAIVLGEDDLRSIKELVIVAGDDYVKKRKVMRSSFDVNGNRKNMVPSAARWNSLLQNISRNL